MIWFYNKLLCTNWLVYITFAERWNRVFSNSASCYEVPTRKPDILTGYLCEISGAHGGKSEDDKSFGIFSRVVRRNWPRFQMWLQTQSGRDRLDDGGSKNLWNLGQILQNCTAQHLRRLTLNLFLFFFVVWDCDLLCYSREYNLHLLCKKISEDGV
jgi:hypothetical protein